MSEKDRLIIFTDGSVDPLLKVGVGACLIISERDLSTGSFENKVELSRFENTSSTRLELQTLIWAFGKIDKGTRQIVVYTDAQNIVNLPQRLPHLERKGYRNRKNNLLRNHDLYIQFSEIMNSFNCHFIKVKGHLRDQEKNEVDRLFSLVDRASRKALKRELL